jgi:hypothetical protein
MRSREPGMTVPDGGRVTIVRIARARSFSCPENARNFSIERKNFSRRAAVEIVPLD